MSPLSMDESRGRLPFFQGADNQVVSQAFINQDTLVHRVPSFLLVMSTNSLLVQRGTS